MARHSWQACPALDGTALRPLLAALPEAPSGLCLCLRCAALHIVLQAGLGDEAAVASTGARFRDTVLALGGSVAPAEVFKAFRGREPSTQVRLSVLRLPLLPSKQAITARVSPPPRSDCRQQAGRQALKAAHVPPLLLPCLLPAGAAEAQRPAGRDRCVSARRSWRERAHVPSTLVGQTAWRGGRVAGHQAMGDGPSNQGTCHDTMHERSAAWSCNKDRFRPPTHPSSQPAMQAPRRPCVCPLCALWAPAL